MRSLYIISPLLISSIDLHDIVVYMNCRGITGRSQWPGALLVSVLLLIFLAPKVLADEAPRQPGLEIRTEAAFRPTREGSLLPDREELRVTEIAVEQTSLQVVTTPDEADVFLDGRYLGRTPIVVRDPGLGMRTLRLSREGYRDLRYEVSLREGIETRVEARLLRRSGYLVIEPVSPRADGAPAEFLLNGERLRGGIHELPVGSYQFQVRRFGFQELRSQITIRPDAATIVHAHLQPQPFELTGLQSSTRVVNPDDVGRLGQVQFRVEATAPGSFLFRLQNQDGEVVRSIGPLNATDFITEVMWDGGGVEGQSLPDGRYIAAVYELSYDEAPGQAVEGAMTSVPAPAGAPALSSTIEINRSFRVRMRSPFSVQAGTALVPGLEVLPPGRLQFAGAVGYHAGAFEGGAPEYYPGVMQVRIGLPARLELGALVGGQFYDDPELHRYYVALGLVHRTVRAEFGPFQSSAGIGLRGTISDTRRDSPAGRPDPFGASNGGALSFPLELGRGVIYLRAAPEVGTAYPRQTYAQDDPDGFLLFFAARLALIVDVGYVSASVSWASRTDLQDNPVERALPDTVLTEVQALIPGTVVFIHAAVGMDYLPGTAQRGFASAGLGVLY